MELTVVAPLVSAAFGVASALIVVYLDQWIQRRNRERERSRAEVRNLAADLGALSERLWRRGWELWQDTRPVLDAFERDGPKSVAAQKLAPKQMAAVHRENETHEETLSAQWRLKLTCPALDDVTCELIEASRLWPPPRERPGEDKYSRRDIAKGAFLEAARKELGTSPH